MIMMTEGEGDSFGLVYPNGCTRNSTETVLSATGWTIVCGLLTTESVTADEHVRRYRADLSGRPLDIQTAGGGSVTATVDSNVEEGSYELYVDCLHNSRRATLSIDGEQTVGVIELDGDATEGLVRKTTIAEGPLSEIERSGVPDAAVRSDLEDGDLLVRSIPISIPTARPRARSSPSAVAGSMRTTAVVTRTPRTRRSTERGSPRRVQVPQQGRAKRQAGRTR